MGKDTTAKVDDDLAEQIRLDAQREGRTFAAQIEHYLKVGRAIARSPDYRDDRVEAALTGGIEVQELSLEEQDAFFAEFGELMQKQGASHAYWKQRQQSGYGVGLDASGNLVRALPGGGVAAY